ncbi:MAG: NAAT family transporter [Nanoarchaeota archaeon]
MDASMTFFLTAFSALFTIMNPFSAASIYLGITRGDTRKQRFVMARKACVLSAIILICFALIGTYILKFFGITIPAFRIAGGILIGALGYSMMRTKRERLRPGTETEEAEEKDDVSVIPLAIPLLAGPGAMTTTIVLSSQNPGFFGVGTLLLAILVVCIISYFVISRADTLSKHLSQTGQNIIERVMGLIVMVVGVQFIIDGMSGVMTLWGLL